MFSKTPQKDKSDRNLLHEDSFNYSEEKMKGRREDKKIKHLALTDTKRESHVLRGSSKKALLSRSATINKNETYTIGHIKQMEIEQEQKSVYKEIDLVGRSMLMFSETNIVRRICRRMVSHQHFDTCVHFLIFVSSFLLAYENPDDYKSSLEHQVLERIDYIISILFALEMCIKIIVYGFMFNGKDSYILNGWNVMDGIIVSFSIISMIFAGVELGIFRILRMLRVLRPLRMISRNPGLRIAIQSLIMALPDIGNVLIVSMLFVLLFAILGINFFKGAFHRCHIPYPTEGTAAEHSIKDNFDCMDHGGDWVNTDQNFDNIGEGMITLINVMITEGWTGVMWDAVDA